ncbi:MAG: hypothetical protein WDO14_03970 [Bacteroidota bacterium]
MKRLLTLGILTLLLTQCAVRYKPIEPEKVEYDQFFENEAVKLSYRYNALYYRGNYKLARLEKRSGLKIIAAAITNKSTRTLNIDRDLDIFTDEEDPYYIDGVTAAKRMSQHPRAYLFYSLLIYAKFDCEFHGLNCAPRYIIPAGVPIAIYNLYRAKNANKHMSAEFEKYSVYTRDIEPGQTIYAILALEFEGKEMLPLQIEVRENSKM